MIPFGFEPKTYSLEGSCSIQLSYGTIVWSKPNVFKQKTARKLFLKKSGWQDSNLRPPRPKRGAIPGYATPRTIIILSTL